MQRYVALLATVASPLRCRSLSLPALLVLRPTLTTSMLHLLRFHTPLKNRSIVQMKIALPTKRRLTKQLLPHSLDSSTRTTTRQRPANCRRLTSRPSSRPSLASSPLQSVFPLSLRLPWTLPPSLSPKQKLPLLPPRLPHAPPWTAPTPRQNVPPSLQLACKRRSSARLPIETRQRRPLPRPLPLLLAARAARPRTPTAPPDLHLARLERLVAHRPTA
mmetsp:Transcript_4464/g.14460  ORF Transcript_4464/g.14460 Transcript_4464/m.14460 type:complete len:218 (-) Transcript_4464:185-838(-)